MKISKVSLQQAREKKLADMVLSICFLASVLVLHGKYGFGKERLQRFSKEFAQTIQDYRNRYDEVALEAMTKHAREKGIEVDWI